MTPFKKGNASIFYSVTINLINPAKNLERLGSVTKFIYSLSLLNTASYK